VPWCSGLPCRPSRVGSPHSADSAAQEFFTSAQFARSEAIRLGEEVTLRGNAMTGIRNWENGWTIFVDANGNGVLDSG